MTGPLSKYASLNAFIRARKSKLPSPELLRTIQRSTTIDEVFLHLRSTVFAGIDEIYRKTADIMQVELELTLQEIREHRAVAAHARGAVQKMARALLMRYEIEAVKNVLRLLFDRLIRGRPVADAPPYLLTATIVYPISWSELMHAESFAEVCTMLNHTPYGETIAPHLGAIAANGQLFFCEVALDKLYYRHLLESISRIGGNDKCIAERIIALEIDLKNISRILRMKTYYRLTHEQMIAVLIPGGRFSGKIDMPQAIDRTRVGTVLKDALRAAYPHVAPLLSSSHEHAGDSFSLIDALLEHILDIEAEKLLKGFPFNIGIVLAYSIIYGRLSARVRFLLNAGHYGTFVPQRKERS
ncbi:MAG: hypothetical protein GF398_06935 [Chitinivibrionales bacterium]|nr:hypothetical protein [Chitinivibrionales bacterium]